MRRGLYIFAARNTSIIDFLRVSLLNMGDYLWVVDYFFNYGEKGAIPDGVYSGIGLNEKLNEKIRPLTIRVRKYPKDTDVASITDLMGYDDYMSSDCLLCIVAWDMSAIDIYAKDEAEQEAIFANCMKIPHDTLEWTTDENDGRTGFSPIGGYGDGYPPPVS